MLRSSSDIFPVIILRPATDRLGASIVMYVALRTSHGLLAPFSVKICHNRCPDFLFLHHRFPSLSTPRNSTFFSSNRSLASRCQVCADLIIASNHAHILLFCKIVNSFRSQLLSDHIIAMKVTLFGVFNLTISLDPINMYPFHQ